jgi:hypothetical protein
MSTAIRTPVGAAYDSSIIESCCCSTGYTKVRQLDSPVLIGQQVCSFDVTMDDTLVVEVDQSFENLGDVDSNEVLRKFSEPFADTMKGAVLTEPECIMDESGCA